MDIKVFSQIVAIMAIVAGFCTTFEKDNKKALLMLKRLLVIFFIASAILTIGMPIFINKYRTPDYSKVNTYDYKKITCMKNNYIVYLKDGKKYTICLTPMSSSNNAVCELKPNNKNFKNCFVPANEKYKLTTGYLFYETKKIETNTLQNTLYSTLSEAGNQKFCIRRRKYTEKISLNYYINIEAYIRSQSGLRKKILLLFS